MCLHGERKCCAMALGNQLRVDNRDCKWMRVQIAHTSVALNKAIASAVSASSTTPLTRTTQLKREKPRTIAMDAVQTKQFELWQLEECDERIKSWKARERGQLGVRVGAKCECVSKLVARVKHDRIDDDDAEDECNEEVLCDVLSAGHRKPCSISDEETNKV